MSLSIAPRQLPLPFPHQPGYHALDFLPAPSNAEALAWLDRTDAWPGLRLALWGEPGGGKTHLLRIWAERHNAELLDATAPLDPAALPPRAAAIDNADLCANESALLHALNAMAESRCPVLLAGRAPPARWAIRLPDLASRLRAVTAVQVMPPDDALLRALLARLLSERQMAVAEPVQEWLLRHLPRDPDVLRAVARRLDEVALASNLRVTRGLAAWAVADLVGPGADDDFRTTESAPSPAQPPLL